MNIRSLAVAVVVGVADSFLPAALRRVGSRRAASSLVPRATAPAFDQGLATLLGGLSFETYNEPSSSSRWERGADGCDVAFQSDYFTRSCYRALVAVTLYQAADLPPESDIPEQLLSGSAADPYVLAAIIEGDADEASAPPLDGALGLSRAVDVARSETLWRGKGKGQEASASASAPADESVATWANETFYLFTRDPAKASLAVTLLDEDILKEDDVIGAGIVPLSSLRSTKGSIVPGLDKPAFAVDWTGVVDLTLKPASPKMGRAAMGAAAGAAMLGGPLGLAIGIGAASVYEPSPARGRLKIRLQCIPLERPADRDEASTDGGPRKKAGRAAPLVGATPGLDWSSLASAADVADAAGRLELCAFVSHRDTHTQAGVYRDVAAKTIYVAFRGTDATVPRDLVTDASIALAPWDSADGGGDDTDRIGGEVHSGFRAALHSVSRRLKEIVVAACDGDVAAYDVVLTGHSLGGALATLCALDLAENGVDASRGLRSVDGAPGGGEAWYGRLADLIFSKAAGDPAAHKGSGAPRPRSLACYTFGAPRCGDAKVAARVRSALPAMYRLVNGNDLIPRLPPPLLGYRHAGRTVLVGAHPYRGGGGDDGQGALCWVEGETDERACPLAPAGALMAGERELMRSVQTGAGVGDHFEQQYFDSVAELLAAGGGAKQADDVVFGGDELAALRAENAHLRRQLELANALLKGQGNKR